MRSGVLQCRGSGVEQLQNNIKRIFLESKNSLGLRRIIVALDKWVQLFVNIASVAQICSFSRFAVQNDRTRATT